MLLPNTASCISVLRTVAHLLWDQLFQPVKMCLSISAVILPILSTIRQLGFTANTAIRSLHIEEGLPSPLVDCLQLQHVLREVSNATKAQIGVTTNPLQSS